MKQELRKFFEEYIAFFEQTPLNELYKGDGVERKGDAISVVGYGYHLRVYAFEKSCYNLDLMESDYLGLLKESGGDEKTWMREIESMDLPTLKALLTYCIRGERFCDGFWIGFLEEKTFARILRRMRELGNEVAGKT